jgi:hypothetical protein
MKDLWAVLMLFLIPIGGGIPAGVLLAKSRGISWPVMMILYAISDVILAFTFEPILKILIRYGKSRPSWARFHAAMKKSVDRSISHYGTKSGPLALVLIAFGVDPMTGRAAAHAAGHGFVSGWLLAITGDMIYFTVLMVCTLWLKAVLGDGTAVMMIILFAMILAPVIIRRVRERMRRT